MLFDTIVFGIAIILQILMMIHSLYFSQNRGYGFPFWAGAIALSILLPQGIAFLRHPELCPPDGFRLTFLVVILCTAALWFGYSKGEKAPVKEPPRMMSAEMWNDATILRCSWLFTLLGLFFYFLLDHIEIRYDSVNGNWTGPATIILFLAQWLKVGMVMAFYLFIKNRSKPALFLVICAMLFVIPAIFFRGRRADTMQLVAMLIFIPFFVKKKSLSKVAFLSMAIAMLLVMCTIHTIRKKLVPEAEDETNSLSYWDRVSEIEWVDDVEKQMEDGGGGELLNCIYIIRAHHQTLRFNFGTGVWNTLLWSYVPGQIVGKDLKRELFICSDVQGFSVVKELYPAYIPPAGAMMLGYSDVFQSFWWFGCIIFYGIGYLMAKWFRKAALGEPAYVIFYTWFLNFALHTIPAMTSLFWTNLFYFLVLVIPFVYILHVPEKKDDASFEMVC